MKRLISNKSQLFGLMTIIAEYVDKHGKAIVSVKTAPKSLEQLGYLHSQCLPELAKALIHAGEIAIGSEDAAKYWLKRKIGYGTYYDFSGDVVFDPASFADADIDVLNRAIDACIWEASQRGGYIAPARGKDV